MIYTLTLNPALDLELTVPALVFDEVLRSTAVHIDYGGKGFNVSRALAVLGADSTALGFIGGLVGEKLAHGLERLGIRTNFVRVAGETRTNISIVDESHIHTLKVNQPGPTISPAEQEALLTLVGKLATPGDWWVMAGSLPPGLPTNFYADLLRLVQDAGAYAALDTSGEALRRGCEARPYLIKPNRFEAAELSGLPLTSPADIPAMMSKLHKLGASHVLISAGSQGAYLSNGQTIWHAGAPTIEARNPIGAGDALVAGLIWALVRGDPWVEALAWGVACGSAAASLSGTEVGSHAQVEALWVQVRVSPLF